MQTAFGKNALEAAQWEEHQHQKEKAPEWEGHCHRAAPASVVFEEPAAKKTFGGQTFDQEELEFLATELYGNFWEEQDKVWELSKEKAYPLGGLKPGLPKDEAALLTAYQWKGKNTTEAAKAVADLVANAGSETAVAERIDVAFGTQAALLYAALLHHVLRAGEPLWSNLRSNASFEGPAPVWNHAVWFFRSTYAEFGGGKLTDDRDMVIGCEIFANVDDFPSDGAPGKAVGAEAVPIDSSKMSLYVKNTFRLQFDGGSGMLDFMDERARWLDAQDRAGGHLYPLLNLQPLGKARASKKSVHHFDMGNIAVDWDLVTSGLLSVRKRFRSP